MAILFAIAGLALLAYPWWTGVEEQAGQQRLASEFNTTKAAPTAPSTDASAPREKAAPQPVEPLRPPGPPPPVYARLTIPTIGLQTYVVDGATLTDYYSKLAWGPAHLNGSAIPGGVGNSVIFGHVDEFGSPFRHLDRLRKGDAILLNASGQTYRYNVLRVWSVSPTDMKVTDMIPGAHDLTLFTCTGVANTKRLIVRASLVGSARVAA